jgi:hypothetical protein
MVFKLKVIDRLGDLQLELAKVNGLLATMRAIGSSEGDGPSSEEVMNMIRVLEDIVSPAYEEQTAIVEEVEEECETPCPPQGEMAA